MPDAVAAPAPAAQPVLAAELNKATPLKVRQAVSLALNRQAISGAEYMGFAQPISIGIRTKRNKMERAAFDAQMREGPEALKGLIFSALGAPATRRPGSGLTCPARV